MRCLLISALDIYQKGTKPLLTPLGLAYLAGSLLKNNNQVKIFQREVEYIKQNFQLTQVNKKMLQLAKEFQPQIVGFTATSATIGDLINSTKILRQALPNALFVCGGIHVSSLPEETLLQAPALDIAVSGDGEEALVEICSGMDLTQIKGIVYWAGDKLARTGQRSFARNLDVLPFPARHLLDMAFYTSSSPAVIPNLTLRTTTIVSSRGCPFACHYCAESRQKLGMRWHSPDYVLGEVEHLLSRYKIEAIYFIDSMFEYNRQRAEEICRLLIKANIHKKVVWSVQSRATSMDQDLLQLMKEAGCIQIEYGFESGSQRILDAMGKKASVEIGVKIAELTKQCGIRIFANMIFGFPGETEADFDESVQFIKKIKPDAIGAYILEAYPGTALYEELIADGKLPVHFHQPDLDWTQEEIQRQIRHLNLSAMPDELFELKMNNFRNEVVRPLTTADLLKNMRLKHFRLATLAKIPLKIISQPLRAIKVAGKLINFSCPYKNS